MPPRSGAASTSPSGASIPSPSPVSSHMIDTFRSPAIIDSLLARGSERSSSQPQTVDFRTPSRRASCDWLIPAASRAPATRSPKVAASGPYQSVVVSFMRISVG